MRYLVLLDGDETEMPEPGTPEFDADLAGYAAFDELAGKAVVGGEVLRGNASCRTVRHDGGTVRVTDGPFAETVEALGGFYVLEAPTLDDAIELTRHIPAASAASGAIEIRPMVQWFDRKAEIGTPEGTAPFLATLHGPETKADEPGTSAWDEGAAAHGRFVDEAGGTVVFGGAVQPVATATTIRVRDDELLVTDGPYAEAMEIVGGFYVLRAPDDQVAAGPRPARPGRCRGRPARTGDQRRRRRLPAAGRDRRRARPRRRLGRTDEAAELYRLALDCAATEPERALLRRRLAELAP